MQANYANALCHLNATPLSVAVLAPCAWGENLVARQIRLGKCGEMGGACGRSGQSENGAVFGRGTSLSLSLVSTRLLKHKTPFYTQKFNLLKFLLKNTLNLSNFSHLYRLRGQNNALYFCYKFLKNLALKEVQG